MSHDYDNAPTDPHHGGKLTANMALEIAERQNATLHDEAMVAQARIENLEAKAALYRAALVGARSYVEAVALSRTTGHIQADCDLRTIDEILS